MTSFMHRISGTPVNADWTRSRDAQRNWSTKRDSLMRAYIPLQPADSLIGRTIIKQVDAIDQAILQYRLNFIKTNPPSYFSMHELYFIRTDLPKDTLTQLYARFPKHLKSSDPAKTIAGFLEVNKITTGDRYLDVTGLDINGKAIALSSVRSKYVLLEFWASWCAPCREEIPDMVKAYQQYHSKGFEIFAFSADANKTSWLNAVRKYSLPWINVSDLKGFYSDAVTHYQVRAIPKNFLIDSNGHIVAIDLHGPDLARKLKSLLPD